MKRIAVIGIGAAVMCAAGCSKSDTTPSGSTAASSSQANAVSAAATVAPAAASSANAPVSGNIVKVTEGVDLSAVRNQQMIHPQYSLTPPEVESPVILAIAQNDEQNTGSVLAMKKVGGTWKVVELKEAGRSEWVFAGSCVPRREEWGILDGAEDDAAALTLVRSADEGSSWQFFAAVKKPVAGAEYAGFSLAANGVGRLSMHLDDDVGTIMHGYYHYATTDGGKTWTGPTFEGDDLSEGESLKDVDTLQEAIKTVEATPGQ